MHKCTRFPMLPLIVVCVLWIMTTGGITFGDTPLTNEMCPVMPDEHAVEAHAVEYKGRTIYFCCRRCIGMFHRDPQAYLVNLPAAEGETAAGHAEDVPHAHNHDDDHDHAATEEISPPHEAHAETDHHDHVHDEMPAVLHWLGHFHVVAPAPGTTTSRPFPLSIATSPSCSANGTSRPGRLVRTPTR